MNTKAVRWRRIGATILLGVLTLTGTAPRSQGVETTPSGETIWLYVQGTPVQDPNATYRDGFVYDDAECIGYVPDSRDGQIHSTSDDSVIGYIESAPPMF